MRAGKDRASERGRTLGTRGAARHVFERLRLACGMTGALACGIACALGGPAEAQPRGAPALPPHTSTGPAGSGAGVPAAVATAGRRAPGGWSETQAAPAETRLARLALDLVVGADPALAKRLTAQHQRWQAARARHGDDSHETLLQEARYLATRVENNAALVEVCDRVLAEVGSIEGEPRRGGQAHAEQQAVEAELRQGAALESFTAASCALDPESCQGLDPAEQALLADIRQGQELLRSGGSDADFSPTALRRRARLYRVRALLDQRTTQARARQVLAAVRDAAERERPAGSRLKDLRSRRRPDPTPRVVPTDPYGAGS